MITFKQFNEALALLENDDYLSRADRRLKDYTLQNLDKWPSEDTLEELLDSYPYDGGTIYRGLNFKNEDQYRAAVQDSHLSGKSKFLDAAKRGIASRYHALNSIDRIREINKMDAIRKLAKDVEVALKALV